jgi:hypothetical protein
MKKLIAIPSNVEVPYDLSNDDVVRVDTRDTDTIFTVIARCGIAIEEFLLRNGKHTLYAEPDKYPLSVIIWKTPVDEFVDTDTPWIQSIRGDELVFPSLHHNYNSSWVAGNPRSIIKWAASCVDLNIPDITPSHRFTDGSPQIWIAWLAHRIGLKVYGQKSI